MMGPMNLARTLTGEGDPVRTLDDIIPVKSPLFGILDNANINPLQVQKSKVVLFCKAMIVNAIADCISMQML